MFHTLGTLVALVVIIVTFSLLPKTKGKARLVPLGLTILATVALFVLFAGVHSL